MEIRDMYGGLDYRRTQQFKGRTMVYRMSNVAPWQIGKVDEMADNPQRLDIYQMYVLPK
jgi:hypothetical protein